MIPSCNRVPILTSIIYRLDYVRYNLSPSVRYLTEVKYFVDLDGARWKLSEECTERRSRTFWQSFIFDTWSVSMNTPHYVPLYLMFDSACPEFSVRKTTDNEYHIH